MQNNTWLSLLFLNYTQIQAIVLVLENLANLLINNLDMHNIITGYLAINKMENLCCTAYREEVFPMIRDAVWLMHFSIVYNIQLYILPCTLWSNAFSRVSKRSSGICRNAPKLFRKEHITAKLGFSAARPEKDFCCSSNSLSLLLPEHDAILNPVICIRDTAQMKYCWRHWPGGTSSRWVIK